MAEEWKKSLEVGRRLCVSYGAERHERFLLAPAERKKGTTKWIVATADWDIYEEDLAESDGVVVLGPSGGLTVELRKEFHDGATFIRFDNGELQLRKADLMKQGEELAIEIGAADKTDKSKKSEKEKEKDGDPASWKKGPPPADLDLVSLEARCGMAIGEAVPKRGRGGPVALEHHI